MQILLENTLRQPVEISDGAIPIDDQRRAFQPVKERQRGANLRRLELLRQFDDPAEARRHFRKISAFVVVEPPSRAVSVNREAPLTIGDGEGTGGPPFPFPRSGGLVEICQRLAV